MHPTAPVSPRSTPLLARTLALLFSLTLLGALFGGTALATPTRPAPQPMIVVFNDDVGNPAAMAAQLGRAHGFQARFVYSHAIKGFAATLSPAAAQALAANPRVAWVEPDGMAYMHPTQDNATWGIDRIDQLTGTDGKYNYNQTGAGVTAYVIDSGIRLTHTEFSGRASYGHDFYNGDSQAEDCNGHGTHVAGTIGGAKYGVAKNVSLVAVKVFGCSGGSSWSTIIAGVDWVTANAVKPAVANMSLGGGGNNSVDAAVRNSIASGISYAIAAGNGNFIGREDDACKYSPARVTEAMTVSATDKSDTKASWANYGNCVDWFAPGVSITSAWYQSDTQTNTISGTSMATPHTAGVAALCLEVNASLSAAEVQSALAAATSKSVVKSSRTANNHLLQNTIADECGGTGGGGGDETDDPPSVSISSPESGSTVSGTVTVSAAASDDNGVSQVEFFVGGDSIGIDSNSDGGWFVSWNTTEYSDASYAITAVATDTANQTMTSDPVTVTVSNSTSGSGIVLDVGTDKVRGVKYAYLSWTGATSTQVDVYRDGGLIAVATANDGEYQDSPGRGGGTHTYQVCEAGTQNCSNTVTVSY